MEPALPGLSGKVIVNATRAFGDVNTMKTNSDWQGFANPLSFIRLFSLAVYVTGTETDEKWE